MSNYVSTNGTRGPPNLLVKLYTVQFRGKKKKIAYKKNSGDKSSIGDGHRK